MLFCETATATTDGIEDLGVLVSQLRGVGIEACIGAGSVPAELVRNSLFDVVAHVRKDPPRSGDSLLIARGHELGDAGLARLRRLALPEGLRTLVLGRSPTFRRRRARH